MIYRNIKSLIKDLGCDELQIEDKKIHERKDVKIHKEIIKRMREHGIISEEYLDRELCFDCGLQFKDCPIKNKLKEELEK